MKEIGKLISEMIQYYSGDVKRISHFLKVYALAKAIGESEELDSVKQEILEVAAVVHDIGIKISEIKYNSSAGHYQEVEGPIVAMELLKKLEYSEELISRVCFLIANHHTYNDIKESDHQILVEADFLVNIGEEGISVEGIKKIQEKIFKTYTGLKYLSNMHMS
ncbi:MAG: phosphohydrolase [Firmicutes bacterium HGW-Firmicutes-1]|jgi:HD superfamily phosphodiesterase|nr:MAG: phosphohydrolase [Firmicutes bacterium HGW-Firmicutes-1]